MKPFNEAFNINTFHCHPRVTKEQQPYNAADTYLYSYVCDNNLLFPDIKIAILNDETGILTYLFREYGPTSISDSFFAKTAIEENFKSSQADYADISFKNSIQFATELSNSFDLVLVKIPKSVTYFTEQLSILRHYSKPSTTVLSAGMVKHLSKNCRTMLSEQLGETDINRVFKKALLFKSTVSKAPKDLTLTKEFTLDDGRSFTSYSNTFSRGKLDRGTALLLPTIPKNLSGKVVDLGCGYGIIAQELKENCPNITELYGVDASRMAAESTKQNVDGCKVLWADGLSNFEDGTLDAVITNPPFHHDNTFSVKMGLRLFKQVHRKLKDGGICIMVANSGLNYGPFLKDLFYRTKAIARDNNYTVLRLEK